MSALLQANSNCVLTRCGGWLWCYVATIMMVALSRSVKTTTAQLLCPHLSQFST